MLEGYNDAWRDEDEPIAEDEFIRRSDNPIAVAPGVSPMTPAHRIEAVLSEDGTLLLDHLPFRAGQAVEVIVLPVPRGTPPNSTLRGTVLHYDQPTAPVADADWGVLE